MTIVNHETGEIIDTITGDEARRLTTEARSEFASATDHFERGWAKIEEAVQGGGHLALGYNSPGHYLHAEFDGVLAGLDVASRRLAVRSMTEWGLSTRAMAKPLSVGKSTVERDVQQVSQVGHLPQTPEPATVGEAETGSGQTPERGKGEPVAGSPTSPPLDGRPAPTPSPAPVVGIDGKTYSRPTPRPKPVVNEDEWSEQDRAEELAGNLARNLSRSASPTSSPPRRRPGCPRSRCPSTSDAFTSQPEWKACFAEGKVVADKDLITIGFDGSRGRAKGKPDATALVGCRVEDGHLFELGVWEATENKDTWATWEPPLVEIEAVTAEYRRVVATYGSATAHVDKLDMFAHAAESIRERIHSGELELPIEDAIHAALSAADARDGQAADSILGKIARGEIGLNLWPDPLLDVVVTLGRGRRKAGPIGTH